jgi:hypothetical protein
MLIIVKLKFSATLINLSLTVFVGYKGNKFSDIIMILALIDLNDEESKKVTMMAALIGRLRQPLLL